jgi:nicotinate phosphoribosyltransferase
MNKKLELVADFYEYTMSNGYFVKNMSDTIGYFDVFFRKVPDNGGYVIVAGLEQVIDYIKNLKFDEEDIDYLRKQNKFSEDFLIFLKDFKFTGDVWAIPEGTVVFPNEPLVTVRAPIIEAQVLETMLLLTVNHQSLIATKTSRIVRESKGRPVMEFGARRAHGIDAAVDGARAAIIGGAVGTSCTLSAKE